MAVEIDDGYASERGGLVGGGADTNHLTVHSDVFADGGFGGGFMIEGSGGGVGGLGRGGGGGFDGGGDIDGGQREVVGAREIRGGNVVVFSPEREGSRNGVGVGVGVGGWT